MERDAVLGPAGNRSGDGRFRDPRKRVAAAVVDSQTDAGPLQVPLLVRVESEGELQALSAALLQLPRAKATAECVGGVGVGAVTRGDVEIAAVLGPKHTFTRVSFFFFNTFVRVLRGGVCVFLSFLKSYRARALAPSNGDFFSSIL